MKKLIEIINIIVVKNEMIDSCNSFIFNSSDKRERENQINKAEALFTEKALEYGADEGEIEMYIADGCYIGGNFSINLVWSDL